MEKPKVIIAIDNSKSISINASNKNIEKLKKNIKKIKKHFTNNNFEVIVVDMEGKMINPIDSLKFNKSSTNLAKQLLAIKSANAHANISSIIFLSDGIFNTGYTPLAVNFDFPLYTIGLGDTTKVKDLAIREIKNNSTVFKGNKLLLEVHILNNGFLKANTPVSVSQRGKKIEKKNVSFELSKKFIKINFAIPITGSGKQSLTVNLTPLKEEFTTLNNVKTIYFDVIDAQKKVLLIASSPHPDIKAMKSAIEINKYYKVDLTYKLPTKLEYDLVIAHQYPTIKTAIVDKKKFMNLSMPKWFIIGTSTDLKYVVKNVDMLKRDGIEGKVDFVKPVFDSKFNAFKLDNGFKEWLLDLPPIAIPYGINGELVASKVLLNQQIGSIITQKPLLFFAKNKEIRTAILLGTNSWKWRLDEFRTRGLHTYYEELISKTVQYLSANPSKKKFYVKPVKKQFEIGEDVLFMTEEYNSLLEKITGNKVALIIKNEFGTKITYAYTPLSTSATYKVSGLTEGIYSYFASSIIEEKKYTSSGQFVVQKLNIEALNPVSDFDLLRKMAIKSKGKFYRLNEIEAFYKYIEELKPVSLIHSLEKKEAFINIFWFWGLLITIASAEWFLRKFSGGY